MVAGPGFSPVWCTANIFCVDPSLGEKTIRQVLELPIERRQVPLLVSREALERCSIWREDALAEYKRALEVMSAKKAAPKRAAPNETEDEVSPSSSGDQATVLANLNTKIFPLTPVVLPEGDSSASNHIIQSDLLELREEKDNFLAKEKEIKTLKPKVRDQDEACSLAAAENVSLREQLERREEEVCDLRFTTETFDVEKTMAVSGAIVVTRWELMREWLNHRTDSWDLEGALERYKMVKTSEAEFLGLHALSFEGEPTIPGKPEAEKTPQPTADDPPTDPYFCQNS
ncbi:hypothetical protein DY000_02047839 [Brassica cretica]|uniref:Uncharacterized protein n=1 Tax=Brassica cretica TaxID=69181 RepID=A0ABQ7EUM0_BRACR|nr:hypothetical protein DY000_02047839 [Brassica cretica]